MGHPRHRSRSCTCWPWATHADSRILAFRSRAGTSPLTGSGRQIWRAGSRSWPMSTRKPPYSAFLFRASRDKGPSTLNAASSSPHSEAKFSCLRHQARLCACGAGQGAVLGLPSQHACTRLSFRNFGGDGIVARLGCGAGGSMAAVLRPAALHGCCPPPSPWEVKPSRPRSRVLSLLVLPAAALPANESGFALSMGPRSA